MNMLDTSSDRGVGATDVVSGNDMAVVEVTTRSVSLGFVEMAPRPSSEQPASPRASTTSNPTENRGWRGFRHQVVVSEPRQTKVPPLAPLSPDLGVVGSTDDNRAYRVLTIN